MAGTVRSSKQHLFLDGLYVKLQEFIQPRKTGIVNLAGNKQLGYDEDETTPDHLRRKPGYA
jgi:hypothetical protein